MNLKIRDYLRIAHDCERAYRLFLDHLDDPTINIRCFNKEEAKEIESYMLEIYPQVKFYVSWMEFS